MQTALQYRKWTRHNLWERRQQVYVVKFMILTRIDQSHEVMLVFAYRWRSWAMHHIWNVHNRTCSCRPVRIVHIAVILLICVYNVNLFGENINRPTTITLFTVSPHWTLSWAVWIQSTSSFFNIQLNIILPSTFRSHQWALSSKIPLKMSYLFQLFLMHATYPVNPIASDLITLIVFAWNISMSLTEEGSVEIFSPNGSSSNA
jgi:hypothetical protein